MLPPDPKVVPNHFGFLVLEFGFCFSVYFDPAKETQLYSSTDVKAKDEIL